MSMASSEELENTSPHAQISQAVLEKKDSGIFQVKVIKQILWIDNARYELREIFGISNSDETAINDMESGKECIICLTEVKNTAVLPCRHMVTTSTSTFYLIIDGEYDYNQNVTSLTQKGCW
ncbi:UNVERIFIED_CONTAM: putative E3 ubiquitin-protein ligase LUL4 [Sesamum radiatum]|uniref:RING-type E3 ubiquitin transferase n=1 Tax=Sesamum radiatum TaxID=300843 RepID=A0AAW2UBN3_SESRA